jgi:hypothetical protein
MQKSRTSGLGLKTMTLMAIITLSHGAIVPTGRKQKTASHYLAVAGFHNHGSL